MTKDNILSKIPASVWIAMVTGVLQITIFIVVVSAKVDNLDKSTATALIVIDGKIADLKTTQATQQSALDTRAQYGIINSDRMTRAEVKIENLESAISTINTNVQRIADRILK